jgi:hydroxypyruvate reductase/glycerate 2-kinase
LNEKKNLLKNIFLNALNSVEPSKLIENKIKFKKSENQECNILEILNEQFFLNEFKNTYVFGSGKASVSMSDSFLDLCDENQVKIKETMVISDVEEHYNPKITVLKAEHPVPIKDSFESSKILFEKLKSLDTDDFFVYFLSGGTSSMLEIPVDDVSENEINEVYKTLLNYSIDIENINFIRTKFSKIKGGQINKYIKASGVIILMSDVIDNRLDVIGSAPFFGMKSNKKLCKTLQEFGLEEKFSPNVTSFIHQVENYNLEEINNKFPHFIIGSNDTMLQNIAEITKKISNNEIDTFILSDNLRGEAKEVAKVLFSIAKTFKYKNTVDLPVLLIFGGETTVNLKNKHGQGGRNQELALAFLNELKDETNITFLSAGTDGIDGNSSATGAVVDSSTYLESRNLRLNIIDYLSNNESFKFFQKTNSLITTGKTGVNLMDITLILVESEF